MTSIGTILTILLGFTFIIFIHELGHFLLARWNGVKVEIFSIGIGPRFLTLFKDKKGTEYVLSFLPLGGYVKLKGQEDIPSSKNSQKTLDKQHYLAKSPLQRLSIILAGVCMNFLSAFLMIAVALNIGIPFTTNKISNVRPNSPAAKAGLKNGNTILAINNSPIRSFEDILVNVAFADDKPLILSVLQDKKIVSLQASPKINPANPLIKQLGISPFPSASIKSFAIPPNLSKNDSKTFLSYFQTLKNQGLNEHDLIKKISVSNHNKILSATTAPAILKLMQDNPNAKFSATFIPIKNIRQSNNLKTTQFLAIPQQKIKKSGFDFAPALNPLPLSPAAKAGILKGDTVVAINESNIHGWNHFAKTLQKISSPSKKIILTILRPPKNEKLKIPITPKFNPDLAKYMIGVSPHSPQSNNTRKISYISPNMQNKIPGLRINDLLVSINPIPHPLISKNQAENNPPVKTYQATLFRDNNKIKFSYDDKNLEEKIVGIPLPIVAAEKFVQFPFFQALYYALPQTITELKEISLFLINLIKGSISPKTMGGPIAIFEVSYTVAEVKGWAYFILLFAKISLSLAVMNLLPIPVLDGGHAAFILYEMIRRKPPPEKVVRTMHLVGFAILILLLLLVNYNDIARLMQN